MSNQEAPVSAKPAKVEMGVKLRGAEKLARIPVKIIPTIDVLRKPDWIRVRVPVSPKVENINRPCVSTSCTVFAKKRRAQTWASVSPVALRSL